MVDLRNHAERVMHDIRKWMEYNHKLMNPKAIGVVENALGKLEKRIARDDAKGMKLALLKLDEIMAPLRKTG